MRSSSPRPRRAFLVTVVAAAVIALALSGVGIYGLLRGPAPTPPADIPSPHQTTSITPSAPNPTTVPHASDLPATNDPVIYARAVAKALFSWDTMSGLPLQESENAIVAGADPEAGETAGLVADLASYLPTDEVWQQLRTYQTSQLLTIDSASIPASWPGIVASSGSHLERGTVAVTITGTRHRTGVWEGQAQDVDSPVSFTVFELCSPASGPCHLLRLSRLNNPLK
jgi:hypothetical protein